MYAMGSHVYIYIHTHTIVTCTPGYIDHIYINKHTHIHIDIYTWTCMDINISIIYRLGFSQIHHSAKANAPARDGGFGPWLLWHRMARQGRAHGPLLCGASAAPLMGFSWDFPLEIHGFSIESMGIIFGNLHNYIGKIWDVPSENWGMLKKNKMRI